MSPVLSMNNKLNHTPRESVLFGQFSGGFDLGVFFSYFGGVSFGDFCASILATFTFILSALLNHIRHVVFMGSEKQMVRANAASIVADMTNEVAPTNPWWDWVVMDNPRNPMRPIYFIVKHKAAITSWIYISGPQPARFSLFNVFPKSVHAQHICHAYGGYV